MKTVLILIIVITSVIGGYLYLHPDEWRDLTRGTPLAPPPAKTYLYKWKNPSGQWQITDTIPAEGIHYELLEYSSDTNVLPLVPERED